MEVAQSWICWLNHLSTRILLPRKRSAGLNMAASTHSVFRAIRYELSTNAAGHFESAAFGHGRSAVDMLHREKFVA